MNAVQWLVLVIGAGWIVWLSRYALWHPGCHGFYRFFALLAILALIVINLPYWFVESYYSLRRVSATVLLFASLFLVLAGVWQLWRQGRPGANRRDPGLAGFETTRYLVTTGVFSWIRHPMYASLLFLTWGVLLKQPSLPGFVLALTATGFLVLTALADERECQAWFGDAYRDYCRRSWRFIPGLW